MKTITQFTTNCSKNNKVFNSFPPDSCLGLSLTPN